MDDGGAVARIQLLDKLRNKVLVLRCLLDRGIALSRSLALARIPRISILAIALDPILPLLDEHLLFQQLQTEIAQRIGTQAAALEALVGVDGGIILQQLRDLAEDMVAYAIGVEGLEK